MLKKQNTKWKEAIKTQLLPDKLDLWQLKGNFQTLSDADQIITDFYVSLLIFLGVNFL